MQFFYVLLFFFSILAPIHVQAALVSYHFSGVVEVVEDADGVLTDSGITSGVSRFSTQVVVDSSSQATYEGEAKSIEPLLTKVIIAEKYIANAEGAYLSVFNDAPLTNRPLPLDGLAVSGNVDLNLPGAMDIGTEPAKKFDSSFYLGLFDSNGSTFDSDNLPNKIGNISSFEAREFSVSSFWKEQWSVSPDGDATASFGPAANIFGTIEDVRISLFNLPTVAPSKTKLQGSILDFNPLAPTIVITHGWQPGGFLLDPGNPNWVNEMAKNISASAPPFSVNVIEAYWDDAHTVLSTNGALERATAQTAMQGMSLAASLSKLSNDFSGGLHFIGHSLGTLVNAYAANTLTAKNIVTDQFTILDRPFARGLVPESVYSPNGIDSDQLIFRTLLPKGKVGHVDNYYGGDYSKPDPASGGPLLDYASAFDSFLPLRDHSGVREFYNSTIIDDDYCRLNGGFGCSLLNGGLNNFPEWDPKLTPTALTKKAIDLNPVTWLYINCVLGSDVSEVLCRESSPAYLWTEEFEFDIGADFIAFDFYWKNGGDGDWLTLHFNDFLLFSFLGDSFEAGMWLNSGLIPVSYLAGQKGSLIFSLNSVGEVNAEISIRNIEISSLGIEAVPEPSTLLLMAIAVLGLAHQRRRR